VVAYRAQRARQRTPDETIDLKQARPTQMHDTGPRSPVEEQLQAWLLAGLDGDARAYRRFLDELAKRLRALLRKRLFGMQDHVEDIVQETLLAVHNARQTYRRDQPVTAWVYAIARYKLMDFLRARMRHDALNDPLDDAADLFEASAEEACDARRDVTALLDALPDHQRLPIDMVKLQGLSVTETARRIGISESAVKVGVHRGLKALAARIRGER
jgi:RNA polymerase sigma-70 factor (ECF subfamily)